MRRAAVSILANISEGWVRKSIKDKLHFIEMAEGSLLELEAEMVVAHDVGYVVNEDLIKFDNQRIKVSYLLYRYKKAIEEKSKL